MQKRTHKLRNSTAQTLLWIFGIIFILAGIGNLGKSTATGIFMLLLGIVFLPLVWNFLAVKAPTIFNRKVRIIGASALFVLAGVTAPQQPAKEPIAETPSQAIVVTEKPKTTTDKNEALTAIEYADGTYTIRGTGLAHTKYTLSTPGSTIIAETNDKGTFSSPVPEKSARFGTIKLLYDTNGAWFGGKETRDEKYLVLNESSSQLVDTLPQPVVLGVGENKQTYELSGYYLPETTLLLKSGDTILAKTKVDKSGRYSLSSVQLEKNYMEVALYEKVSTGWSSSREEKRSDTKFIDTSSKQLLKDLPVITKEVSTTEPMAFGSRTVESGSLNKGQTQVSQEGANGEKTNTYKVTFRGNDEVARELVRSDITKQPVEKITTVGTYVYVAPAPRAQTQAPQSTSGGRVGATCRDGSHSNATGRGACSHHGGVAQWLYR